MGTLVILSSEDPDSPFGDLSMFDACIDPQYNGVFPDDPSLGIVSERKANERDETGDSFRRKLSDDQIRRD